MKYYLKIIIKFKLNFIIYIIKTNNKNFWVHAVLLYIKLIVKNISLNRLNNSCFSYQLKECVKVL